GRHRLRSPQVSVAEGDCGPVVLGGGAYVNMMMDEGQERVRASYGDNYDRLAQIKATYDPGNLFRVNQNIQPKA
ncbi:MAG TPA: BBE domain-containing protein, partial [Solirubrobacterales bacterium]